MTESNVEMQLRLKKERVDQLRQEVEEKQKLIYESKGEIEALLSLLVREKDLLRGTVWVIESGLYDEWLSGDGCLRLAHSSEAIDEMAKLYNGYGISLVTPGPAGRRLTPDVKMTMHFDYKNNKLDRATIYIDDLMHLREVCENFGIKIIGPTFEADIAPIQENLNKLRAMFEEFRPDA